MKKRINPESPTQNLTIKSLWDSRDRLIIPPFQRGVVWRDEDMQFYCDTILRGYNVASFMFAPREENDRIYNDVIDGQQRLNAVLHFLAGDFRTLSKAQLSRLSPLTKSSEDIPFQSYFEKLPTIVAERFLARTLPVVVVEGMSAEEQSDLFRRLQHGRRLSKGETLHSYVYDLRTKTAQTLARIYEHSFWKEMSFRERKDGKKTDLGRMQTFHMCLICLYLETFLWPANLRSESLEPLASGGYDGDITAEVEAGVKTNLTAAMHLFRGAHISAVVDMVPIYQAALILSEGGFDLEKSEEGCLAHWYHQARTMRMEEGHWVTTSNTFAGLLYKQTQQLFWESQRATLLVQPGLFRKRPLTEEELKQAKLAEGKKAADTLRLSIL